LRFFVVEGGGGSVVCFGLVDFGFAFCDLRCLDCWVLSHSWTVFRMGRGGLRGVASGAVQGVGVL
jgi:hypothetical protein